MSGIPVLLTATQSCSLYGLFQQPRSTLAWEDILKTTETGRPMTWKLLRSTGIELTPTQLHDIQPDKTQWLQRGLVSSNDIPDMLVFPVNPLTDFKADMAELWRMMNNTNCSADNLVEMGVTFDQLLKRGMTPEIMFHFKLSLCEWQALGLRRAHVEDMQELDCQKVFQLDKSEIMHILKTICGD